MSWLQSVLCLVTRQKRAAETGRPLPQAGVWLVSAHALLPEYWAFEPHASSAPMIDDEAIAFQSMRAVDDLERLALHDFDVQIAPTPVRRPQGF